MRKFLLVIFYFTLAATAGISQILPDWSWAKSISGSNGVQVQDLQMDNEGNMYVSGTAYRGPLSIDGSVFTSDSNQHIILAKFNSSGSLLWKATVVMNDMQFMGSIHPESLMLDKSNNVYITIAANGMGGGSDTLHLTLNSNVQKDFALIGRGYMELPMKSVIKLDENGKLIYISGFEGYGMNMGKGKVKAKGNSKGNNFSLSFNDMKVDDLGNLFVAGSFRADSLILGSFKVKSYYGWENSFITKLDTAGKFEWVTIDSTSSPSGFGGEANSLLIDASGNPLVFGDFGSPDRKFGSFTIDNYSFSTNNLYFVSLDKKDGTPLFLNIYGGDGSDFAGSFYTDSKGNHYITGYTSSTSLFGQSSSGSYQTQIFLANIDESANIIWSRIINSELSYYSSGNTLKLAFTPDDFPVLSGLFQAKSLVIDELSADIHDTAAIPSSNDFFTVKFDPSNQTAVDLNTFGTQSYDYDFNIFCDKHNITTLVFPLIDTIIYIGADTISIAPPASGFVIANLDSSFKLVGKKTFIPYTGQNMSVNCKNIIQSYSGYIGVAGGYYGKNLYLGTTTLSTLDTNSFNMFIAKMGYTINGTIYDISGSFMTSGIVELYVLAQDGPAMREGSVSVSVDNGSYQFTDAPLSGSLLYAIPDTVIYKNYVGTYAGNSMIWSGAAILDLLTANPSVFDISVKQVLPTTGQGSIAGTVTETISKEDAVSLKFAGRPMKGASVVLVGKSTKGSDTIIAVTQTDEAGYYQFNKIPAGDYKVWIDVAGLGMKEYYGIMLSDASPVFSNIDYIVSETGIYKDLSSGIKISKRKTDVLSVYPNPAHNYIGVSVSLNGSLNARFEIYSLSGALLKTLLVQSASNGLVTIKVDDLTPGIYLLKAEYSGNAPLYSRFVRE